MPFRVIGALVGLAAVGVASVIVTYIAGGLQPTLQQQINKRRKCALCNQDVDLGSAISLQCTRHVLHSGCHRTLEDEGQTRCPVCAGNF